MHICKNCVSSAKSLGTIANSMHAIPVEFEDADDVSVFTESSSITEDDETPVPSDSCMHFACSCIKSDPLSSLN